VNKNWKQEDLSALYIFNRNLNQITRKCGHYYWLSPANFIVLITELDSPDVYLWLGFSIPTQTPLLDVCSSCVNVDTSYIILDQNRQTFQKIGSMRTSMYRGDVPSMYK